MSNLWSAPSLGEASKYDPANESAGFKFIRPYARSGTNGGGPYSGNQQQQFAQGSSALISSLGQIMAQRKKDQMYQVLMQQELKGRPDLLQRYAQAGLTGQAAYEQMANDIEGERKARSEGLKDQLILKHLNSPAGNTVDITLPDGRTVKATADAALQYYMRSGKPAASDRALNTILAKHGLTVDDLHGVDFTTPGDQGGIQYGNYNEDGTFNPQDAATATKAIATGQGKGLVARGGGLTSDVPLQDWLTIAARTKALGRVGTDQAQQPQESAPPLTDPSGDPNATPPADNPSPVGTDLKTRAQQALADPNASPEAKAAAQQILANAGSNQ